ncbi:MAG: disulfide bond formation protein B [bacterium]|nr:disulfide bond formation protein B [bacterium]
MQLSPLITPLFSYLTLFSHILLVGIILSYIFRNSWGRGIVVFLSKNYLLLGFLVSLLAIIGSLSFSNIVGFDPCVLCWWQRVFIYPLPLLFLVALIKKDRGVYKYAIPLSLVGGIIALYHSYINLGGSSILPCTAEGSACAKLYVFEFGYIIIPLMSLTIALYIITLSLIARFGKEN